MKIVLRTFWSGLLQHGPMEEGIAPAVASERLTIFLV